MDDTSRAASPDPSCATAPPAATGHSEAASKLDGGIRTAASVASYLRSAIRRRGDLFRAQDSSSASVAIATDGETDGESDDAVDRTREAALKSESDSPSSSSSSSSSASLVECQRSSPLSESSTGQSALERMASSESLRSPSVSTRGDHLAPSPASSHATRRYEVTCEHMVGDSEIPDDREGLDCVQSGPDSNHNPRVQYVDVLLQTDAHGLGLNVGSVFTAASEALAVMSFRRLHSGDIGPAEASGKVRVGDELFSIEGERMTSTQQLYAKVSGVESGSFLLLRFLRLAQPREISARSKPPSVPDTYSIKDDECEEKASPSLILDVEHAVRDSPQVSALIRDLVTTNQRLQEQLLASRLKQDELSIQLDQLYSLYARTQLDSGLASSFSFPKTLRPFAWRNGQRAEPSDDSASARHPLGINRSAYSSKVLLEIEDAVSAEYERLRRNFELQYALDKQQLERRFGVKAQKLEAAMAKKVDMLQAGLEQVARGYGGRGDGQEVARCCQCDRGISSNISEGNRSAHHKTAQLQKKMQSSYDTEQKMEEESSRRKLEHIVAILDAYRHQRAGRRSMQTLGDVYEKKMDEA